MSNRVWRTTVRYDPGSDVLRVVVGRQNGQFVEYLKSIDSASGGTIRSCDQHESVQLSEVELRITEDVAKSLLEALAEYFGGTGDTRQLRKDYEAERARVDKLIAVTCRPPLVVNRHMDTPMINLEGRG